MKNSPAIGPLKKLITGTAILTAAAVLTKIVGLFYKIPLIKYVGIEGMAYFLAANHIYVFLFVISTAGLPVAVSIMVSEASAVGDENRISATFSVALRIFMLIGTVGTLFMLVAARQIAEMINISGAVRCINAIAPAVLLACVCGAYRGYFQGRQIMKHTAISQVIEAFGKLILGLLGAIFAVKQGYGSETVAAFAIAGITAGIGLSMLYLLAAKALYDRRYKKQIRKTAAPVRGVAGRLIRYALPITLSSAVISMSGLIDTSLIANCLMSAGFSESMTNKLYSCYGNIAVPLFSLTPALIAPISLAAVPLISAALKEKDTLQVSRVTNSAFKITLLVALPASVGLAVFSKPIIRLIFPNELEATNIAAPLLSLLALSIVTACLITTTNAVLQSNGRATKTIISMLLGAGVKIITEYFLIKNPAINIAGAPISTFLCNLTVVAANTYQIAKHSKLSLSYIKSLLPITVSALLSVGGAMMVFKLVKNTGLGTYIILPALFTAVLIYPAAAILTGAVDSELVGALPGGGRIAKRLERTKKNGLEKTGATNEKK